MLGQLPFYLLGYTGRSLSLVSRYIHQTSEPARYTSNSFRGSQADGRGLYVRRMAKVSAGSGEIIRNWHSSFRSAPHPLALLRAGEIGPILHQLGKRLAPSISSTIPWDPEECGCCGSTPRQYNDMLKYA
ncbi:hypothetical protein K438DRAFT_1805708 [Mycena galopus ATCC 62051]|nr:hypothetical protein K438DRAFT_1805708 [Mycena galopus ATCC 62051]